MIRHLCLGMAAALAACTACRDVATGSDPDRIGLSAGWHIRSSAEVGQAGSAISIPLYDPTGWIPATVPTTVLAALLTAGAIDEPEYGMNLERMPGNIALPGLPMPNDSPYRMPWWYRTAFELPDTMNGRRIGLVFDGINYRAEVWLNGRRLAGPDEMAGAFRRFEFDVSGHVINGENVLAVLVHPPTPESLAIHWVDWNPPPPDGNMGIWRPVELLASGPVSLRHPYVETELALPGRETARLTVHAELHNGSSSPLEVALTGSIEGFRFEKRLALGPDERREVSIGPDEAPGLEMRQPRVWWPAGMGGQDLYRLSLAAVVDGEPSDTASFSFGIRSAASRRTPDDHLLFSVNGRDLLIRGAGWASDWLLRTDPDRQAAELAYVRDIGLNAIRLEGKFEDERFFDLCDRLGILVIAGWCCCDHWERWHSWTEEDHRIAPASLRDQIRRMRHHPSLLAWMNGSDFHPPAAVEQAYLDVLEELRWPAPVIASADDDPSELTGTTGVKMTGPYDWVPPSYWLLDTERGGAWGFNTETGPGPAIPPRESLERFIPEEELWPIGDAWEWHAGRGQFGQIDLFARALERRHGPATGLDDFVRKAEALAYEGQRALFEAYGRNKYRSTGVIQWMLNNGWPSIIWHLYDWYLLPGAGYFGAKKALEPVHVQFSYDDRTVVAVHSRPERAGRLRASAGVYDLDGVERYARTAEIDLPVDGVATAFIIPAAIDGIVGAHLLRLELHDQGGSLLSENVYWLSTVEDEIDWGKGQWYYTPTRAYADLTGLQDLPVVALDLTAVYEAGSDERRLTVTLVNPTGAIAFMTRLMAIDTATGLPVTPVRWNDNYVTLLPGESRQLSAALPAGSATPLVRLSGWNVEPVDHAVE